jgi:hypothetical protein
MPERIWARVRGGGVSLPSGKPYLTVVGESREQNGCTEYVRADLFHEALDLAEAANLPNDLRDGKYANTKRIQELRAQLVKLSGESNG